MRSYNQPINILKAISAFLVVCIHVPFPGLVGDVIIAFARVAVPFFFYIAGFFFNKGSQQAELYSISRKVKKLFKLLLLSEILYFSFYVSLQIMSKGLSLSAVKTVISAELIERYWANLRSYLPIFAPPFNGTFWFVGSLIAVYLLMYPIVKYNLQGITLVCSIFTLCVGFLLSRVHWECFYDLPVDRLLPSLPIPFFMLGYYFRKYILSFDTLHNRTCIIVLCLGILLTIAEQFTGKYTLYIGSILILLPTMFLVTKYRNHIAVGRLACFMNHVGQNLSGDIYIFHMIVMAVVRIFFSHMLPSVENTRIYLWVLPILVCLVTTLCAHINHLIKKKLNLVR